MKTYERWGPHEITTSDDKGRQTTRYYYEIPDDAAVELVKAGKVRIDDE